MYNIVVAMYIMSPATYNRCTLTVCNKRFRRILKLDTKRKMKNNEKPLQNNSMDIETPQQTSAGKYIAITNVNTVVYIYVRLITVDRCLYYLLDHTFDLPKHMIRDSVKEYTEEDYDLSCLFRKRHGKKFLRAPKIPYAHVFKYSK